MLLGKNARLSSFCKNKLPNSRSDPVTHLVISLRSSCLGCLCRFESLCRLAQLCPFKELIPCNMFTHNCTMWKQTSVCCFEVNLICSGPETEFQAARPFARVASCGSQLHQVFFLPMGFLGMLWDRNGLDVFVFAQLQEFLSNHLGLQGTLNMSSQLFSLFP